MKKIIAIAICTSLALPGCTIMVSPSHVVSKGIAFDFKSSKSAINMEGCIINNLRETILIKPTSARSDDSSRIYGEFMDQLVIVIDITETPEGSAVKYYKDFSYILTSESRFENAVKSCQ